MTASEQPSPEELKQPAVAVTEARDKQPSSLAGLRVLVVDDEIDARTLLSAMLERCGAQVVAVSSAREGLESVESWQPDVLIADIGMPVEDGYGLIKKVRALPKERGGQTPALALTAYARTEDRVRALSEGYQVHLAKPRSVRAGCSRNQFRPQMKRIYSQPIFPFKLRQWWPFLREYRQLQPAPVARFKVASLWQAELVQALNRRD